MNLAIEKTLALLLLIGIGILLKGKLTGRDQLGGVKLLILSVALPATIFVALLKIKVDSSLLFLPLLALGFNGLMLIAAHQLLPLLGIGRGGAAFRTYLLLLPSLAPGLSCFPFLMEYLGEESLALAALADVGNKVFVLILLYLLAMRLYYRLEQQEEGQIQASRGQQLKGLLRSLLREPVNLVIVAALTLLGLGWNIDTLPAFLSDPILRLSAMMTPLVLVFIGMAVRFRRQQFREIFLLLLCRSGLAFILSALLLLLLPPLAPALALLAVAFPQSAASFWPFAHISAVAALEKGRLRTFKPELALNILALSLPFSTLMILAVCAIGGPFAQPLFLFPLGLGLILAGAGGWKAGRETGEEALARNAKLVVEMEEG